MLGLPALGYVVAQAELVRALRKRLREEGVETLAGASVTALTERPDEVALRYARNGEEHELAARAAALAEGGTALAPNAPIVERAYRQCALTATITAQYAAPDCAYERFTPRGPIALLPIERAHALVWTVPSADAEDLLALADSAFERAVEECYGSRIGTVRLQGPRAAFPLKLRIARRLAGTRVVLIGNSAQTLHPVAGQGFNLGLRDAYELAAMLGACIGNAQALPASLRRYRAQRRVDRAGGALFTDFLVRVFCNDNPLIACARSAALAGLDAIEPAKRFLMRRMIFGAPR
jgi:2-octaprenyl-6-methoxyphenol hydroxylase